MSKILLRIIPVIFFAVIFVYVLFNVEYPQSLTQASFTQLMLFFIPLSLVFVFTFNIFLKSVFSSSFISLGIISLLVLKALEALNLVTGGLTIISVGLFISYFKKNKRGSLTKWGKIPKLTRLKKGESKNE